MEEREHAYLEALVSLRDRSALFDAVNRVIPRSVFGILGLRSDKRRSRPNRGRNGNKSPPRSTPAAGPSAAATAAATAAPYTPARTSAQGYTSSFCRPKKRPAPAPAVPTAPPLTPEDQVIADRHDAALREADEIIRQAKRRKFSLTASKKDSARLTSIQQSISTNLDALVDLTTRPKPFPSCPDVLPSVKDILKGHIADCQRRLEEQKQEEATLKPARAKTPTVYLPKSTRVDSRRSRSTKRRPKVTATTSKEPAQTEPRKRIAAPGKDQVESDRSASIAVTISRDNPLVLGSPVPRNRQAARFRPAAQTLPSIRKRPKRTKQPESWRNGWPIYSHFWYNNKNLCLGPQGLKLRGSITDF